MNSFKPYISLSPVSQALDGSSHTLALPKPASSNDAVRIIVTGTEKAAIKFGSADSITASDATDMLMLANSVEVFTLDTGITHIAVDGATGSTVQITMGTGL